MVNRRTVVGMVEARMAARRSDFGGDRLLIQLNAQARLGRQRDVAIFDEKWLFQIPLAQRDLFLGQKVRDCRIQLQAGGQRDWPKGTVGRNRRMSTAFG